MQHLRKPLNIVVTGGSRGLGFGICQYFYEKGHNVIFGARSQTKNQMAVDKIRQKQGGSIKAFELNLQRKESIRGFVQNVKADFNKIDILINNSSTFLNQKTIGQMGIDKMLNVNHFGHFYLTYCLFDLIRKANQSRIIILSSGGYVMAKGDVLENMKQEEPSGAQLNQYLKTKLANLQFAIGLSQRIEKAGIIDKVKVVALNPGLVDSGDAEEMRGTFFKFFMNCLHCCCCCWSMSGYQGAQKNMIVSEMEFEQLKNGGYYDQGIEKPIEQFAADPVKVNALWQKSQQLLEITFRV